jgi:hypothetical protein
MGPFDSSAGAVTFWLFVMVISVVGTILPYLKHRETQRTIRAAIDKGQPIDPALLAPPKKDESNPRTLVVVGAVLIAAGLGMQVLAICIGIQANMVTVWPVNGAGAVALFIGVALVGVGRWQMKSRG